jgi:hypothetical protein
MRRRRRQPVHQHEAANDEQRQHGERDEAVAPAGIVVFGFVLLEILVFLARLRRPDRSAKRGAEGSSLNDRRLVVERRSLRYASLRSAPVGTTGWIQTHSVLADRYRRAGWVTDGLR